MQHFSTQECLSRRVLHPSPGSGILLYSMRKAEPHLERSDLEHSVVADCVWTDPGMTSSLRQEERSPQRSHKHKAACWLSSLLFIPEHKALHLTAVCCAIQHIWFAGNEKRGTSFPMLPKVSLLL
ncbi:unnamed protein product [Eretmochelys imbricata]